MTTGRSIRRRHNLERGAEVELGHRLKDRCGLLDGQLHAPLLPDPVEETVLGAIGAGVPADAAGNGRAQWRVHLAFREVAATDQLAGLRIDALDEVDVLYERPDVLDLGVGTIIDEDVSALVGVHHELLAAAVEHDEFAHGRVEVPGIVRQLLMVEFELAGIGIERDDRGRVEIVARPRSALLPVRARPVVERRRVGGAPPYRIGFRVIGSGHPAAAAAGPPGVATPGRHGLFGTGDREELPLLLSGLAVDAEDRSATGPFAALGANDHLVLDHQRRASEADRHLLGIQQLGVPHRLAVLQIERDQAPVDRADIEIAVSDGDAAVVGRVGLLGDQILIQLRRVGPDGLAGRAIQRVDAAVGARIIQHTVKGQRR